MSGPLIVVEALSKSYTTSRGPLRPAARRLAVDAVSFQVARGETLAVVGESGAGKSTLGRCLVRLEEPDVGRILFDGAEIGPLQGPALRAFRRRIQIVFQDPYGSLNPRMRVGTAVREPIDIHRVALGEEADRRVTALFTEVGLDPSLRDRYPHELSGGQRQRVGIARALASGPEALVLDEPVSALDVSVQAQVLALLRDLQQRRGLTYLFVAHDLAIVRQVADRVLVMYRGAVMEDAPAAALFADPRHPYTRALLAAVPRPDPDAPAPRADLRGDRTGSGPDSGGCPFYGRCDHPERSDHCRLVRPRLETAGAGHRAACHVTAPPVRSAET